MRKNLAYGLLLMLMLITIGVSGCVTTGETCEDMCGDGICQEVVCQAIGCPCAETAQTCPQDCKSSELPNPAAVYCERDKGGVYQIEQIAEGKSYCSLPDGRTCEAWEFFRTNATDCVPPE